MFHPHRALLYGIWGNGGQSFRDKILYRKHRRQTLLLALSSCCYRQSSGQSAAGPPKTVQQCSGGIGGDVAEPKRGGKSLKKFPLAETPFPLLLRSNRAAKPTCSFFAPWSQKREKKGEEGGETPKLATLCSFLSHFWNRSRLPYRYFSFWAKKDIPPSSKRCVNVDFFWNRRKLVVLSFYIFYLLGPLCPYLPRPPLGSAFELGGERERRRVGGRVKRSGDESSERTYI